MYNESFEMWSNKRYNFGFLKESQGFQFAAKKKSDLLLEEIQKDAV